MTGQRGAVLLLLMLVLLLGLASILTSRLPAILAAQRSASHDEAILARAKAALRAWSSLHCAGAGNMATVRSGELPFPDDDLPGETGYGTQDAVPGTRIGRLPWKTLGLPELLDSSGAPLWYVVHADFVDASGSGPGCSGQTLDVYQNDGSTRLAAGQCVMAVILAPGAPGSSQMRSTSTEQRNPVNYLESASIAGRLFNHASAGGPFINGPTATINDRITTLSWNELVISTDTTPCAP